MTAAPDRAAVPCRVGATHQHMIDGGLHPPYGKIGGITPLGASANVSKLPPELANHPDYEIIRELGRGGMGIVFLAHNRIMGRDEVLKVIGPDIIESPGVLDRFLREIRAVARLQHPNIVTAHSAFRCGESLVFAMEYVEGLDLARLVKAKGPVPVGHACYFVHQAALGLQHAHEAGMVHRDIKPGNLMLTHKRGKALIKVLDFGLAKAAASSDADPVGPSGVDREPESAGLTLAGQMLGTPDFIAPEQIADSQKRRHPGGHLQPGLHALLPAERPSAVPGGDAARHASGATARWRPAAEPGAAGGAGRAGGDGGQDDGEGAGAPIPDTERSRRGSGSFLQEAGPGSGRRRTRVRTGPCARRRPGRGWRLRSGARNGSWDVVEPDRFQGDRRR